jgi:hypothetical protein
MSVLVSITGSKPACSTVNTFIEKPAKRASLFSGKYQSALILPWRRRMSTRATDKNAGMAQIPTKAIFSGKCDFPRAQTPPTKAS